MKFARIFLLALFVIYCSACSDSNEVKEQQRLNSLFALDDSKIALAHYKGGAANSVEYLAVKRECAKEKYQKNGKWCEKYNRVERHYDSLVMQGMTKLSK